MNAFQPFQNRPEFQRHTRVSNEFGVVEKQLTAWERLYGNSFARKAFLLLMLAAAWEVYGRSLSNPLLFPTFGEVAAAFGRGMLDGSLPTSSLQSLYTLLYGYAIGLALAALLTGFAISTQIGSDLLELLTSMLNPLPAIALLPLALIWFGLGQSALIFVLVHSVLWAVALNTLSGFLGVSVTLRMVGRNYGLASLRYIVSILIPGAFPSILTGLKIGWAFAWRTLIAAELVFGVSSGEGGLGWYIYQNKNALEIANVFAGLLLVTLIGLFVEVAIFRTIEMRTVRRWGQQT